MTAPRPAQAPQCRGSQSEAHGFRVRVRPGFSPEHSDPLAPRYVFTYRIRVENVSGPGATLLTRHWIIIDAHGRRDEVRGEGVVGKQPRLLRGESFEYESFCPLRTRWGTMEGSYRMAADDGREFRVPVARFYLAGGA